METSPIENLQGQVYTAGLDTTTGHGVDSIYRGGELNDPWAWTCLSNYIDVIVNHRTTYFPLWSKSVIDGLDDTFLPNTFAKAVKQGLLEVKSSVFADEIWLEPKLVNNEFEVFAEWARRYSNDLKMWSRYHLETPHIIGVRRKPGPWDRVDEIWPQRNGQELSRKLGISEPHLKFGFQTYIRAIQYYRIIGETSPYFPHPVRERALGFLPIIQEHPPQWSWGRYFSQLLMEQRVPKDIDWLLEYVSKVKACTEKHDANWYSLDLSPQKLNQAECDYLT